MPESPEPRPAGPLDPAAVPTTVPTAASGDAPAPEETRRGFLGLSALLASIIGALVAIPVVPFFAAPILKRGREQGTWVPLGDAEGFGEEHREVEYSFQYQDGWYASTKRRRVVVGKKGPEWTVLSTVCTHVGCGVQWSAEKRRFLCPCHGAVFNDEGIALSGPATEPLARLEARVNEQTGQLEVKEA